MKIWADKYKKTELLGPSMLMSDIFKTEGWKSPKDFNMPANIKHIYFDFDPGLKTPVLLAD